MNRLLLSLATVALLGCDRSDPGPMEQDLDGDGFASDVDCDDEDADVHPGQDERCNGVDDDCDGVVDNDGIDERVFYRDADGDGIGVSLDSREACEVPAGYSETDGDCDDSNFDVHPGAVEICMDALDNDCAGPGSTCALRGSTTTDAAHLAWRDLGLARCTLLDVDMDGLSEAVCSGTPGLVALSAPLAGPVPRPASLASATDVGRDVALADITGDGVVDAVLATGKIVVGPLSPGAEVTPWVTLPVPAAAVEAGDFTGDGHVDVAYLIDDDQILALVGPVAPDTVAVDASAFSITLRPEDYASTIEAGMLLDDDVGALIVGAVPEPAVVSWRMRGEHALADLPRWDRAGTGRVTVLPDVTGDGSPELALAGRVAGAWVVRLWSAPVPTGADERPPDVRLAWDHRRQPAPQAVGDLDGDGTADLVVFSQDPTWDVVPGPLDGDVLEDDVLLTVAEVQPHEGIGPAAIGDGDGDGRPDLLLMSRASSARNAWWFLGHGE